MKFFSIQGIIALFALYVAIDRLANYSGYYTSAATYSIDYEKKGLGLDFSWQSFVIMGASVVIVLLLPKIF